MIIEASFTNNGIPATGLSATIRIRELPNTLVVTDESMIEAGDGTYYYDYIGYDVTKNYSIRCDGSAVLSDSDRYKFAGNENYYEDTASSVWSEKISGYTVDGTFGKNINSDLKRILGLMHENIYIDNPIYDGDGNLTSARVRIYSSATSVGTTNDVICKFTTWSQIEV